MTRNRAQKKLKKQLLADIELTTINNLRAVRNSEEIITEIETLKALRAEIEETRIKVDTELIIKSAVTIGCVLLTLHYESENVITTKLWSKIKF